MSPTLRPCLPEPSTPHPTTPRRTRACPDFPNSCPTLLAMPCLQVPAAPCHTRTSLTTPALSLPAQPRLNHTSHACHVEPHLNPQNPTCACPTPPCLPRPDQPSPTDAVPTHTFRSCHDYRRLVTVRIAANTDASSRIFRYFSRNNSSSANASASSCSRIWRSLRTSVWIR